MTKTPDDPVPGPVPGLPGWGGNDALSWLVNRGGGAPRAAAPAPPATPPQTETQVATAAHFKALDALRAGRTPAAVVIAVAAATTLADRAWAELRPAAEARKQPGFACTAGCAWCCHQQVAAAPAEILAIADHVVRNFTPPARAALLDRLAALDARSRGLGLWGRAGLKTPCALLVDGQCSVYEVRPLRCRGVYSRNADHCRWAMETPDEVFGNPDRHAKPGPYPVEPAKIMDAALTGMARAFNEFGLAWEALELTAALRLALETPDSATRYLAGAPIFAGAELPERDDAPPTAARVQSDRPGLAKPSDSA